MRITFFVVLEKNVETKQSNQTANVVSKIMVCVYNVSTNTIFKFIYCRTLKISCLTTELLLTKFTQLAGEISW